MVFKQEAKSMRTSLALAIQNKSSPSERNDLALEEKISQTFFLP